MEYVFVRNVGEHGQVPEQSILSSTLQSDAQTKVILFRFAAGQELSAHTAPFPAMLYFVSGEARVRLGADEKEASGGTFVYMSPKLEHGIRARTEVVMLLVLVKAGAG